MSDMTTRDQGSGVDPGLRPTDSRSAFDFQRSENNESVPDLIRRLAEESSHLAQQQLKLVEAEVRSGLDDIKQSVGAMAGAAVLGIAGLGVLLMGISFLLAKALPLWAATLIVAVATLAGAYAMFAAGRKKMQSSSLGMERSRRTLERAPSAITGSNQQEQKRGR